MLNHDFRIVGNMVATVAANHDGLTVYTTFAVIKIKD
jgi:hypothetical protein